MGLFRGDLTDAVGDLESDRTKGTPGRAAGALDNTGSLVTLFCDSLLTFPIDREAVGRQGWCLLPPASLSPLV